MSSIFEAVAGGVTGLASGIAGAVQGQQNYQLAREQYDYERSLQDRIFAREDSALQRYVADARKAGISPLAGLGGSGTGSVVSTSAPVNRTVEGAVDASRGAADTALSLITASNQIAMSEAQRKLVDQQRRNAELDQVAHGADAFRSYIEASSLHNLVQNVHADAAAARGGPTSGEAAASAAATDWYNHLVRPVGEMSGFSLGPGISDPRVALSLEQQRASLGAALANATMLGLDAEAAKLLQGSAVFKQLGPYLELLGRAFK